MRKSITTLVSDATRLAIAADTKIGAGNFFQAALANSPAPEAAILFLEKPLKTFWGEEFSELSLLDLDRLAQTYASLYKKQGVRAQDPIFIYFDDGAEYLVHYLALTRIGAIGVLTNANMPAEVALAHARNVGCLGIYTDTKNLARLASLMQPSDFKFVCTDVLLQAEDRRYLPTFCTYQHAEDDPIMIAHSSGTTGIPKAVLLQHDRFFFGVRDRLKQAKVSGSERILSSLPHSHNCAIAYIMLALLSGSAVYITSDHSGRSVLQRISEFQPSMVVSFPQTYVEMTEQNMDDYDLSSVNLWFNGGDAAHESHIRALIQRGSHEEKGRLVHGSIFIDGMGSSEMGFSLFRNVHTLKTNNYNRCVGTPHPWVDAQILSEEGDKLEPFRVGRLGVKAPSVTSGYWNNSLLTYRSRLAGYFLTGDLAYRDEQGRFFHVDRVPDVILTANGPVYGLQTEEFLLSKFPDIADCSVLGKQELNSDYQKPVVYMRVRPCTDLSTRGPKQILALVNMALTHAGLPRLCEVKFVQQLDIPLGTTGKVLKRVLRENNKTA